MVWTQSFFRYYLGLVSFKLDMSIVELALCAKLVHFCCAFAAHSNACTFVGRTAKVPIAFRRSSEDKSCDIKH